MFLRDDMKYLEVPQNHLTLRQFATKISGGVSSRVAMMKSVDVADDM